VQIPNGPFNPGKIPPVDFLFRTLEGDFNDYINSMNVRGSFIT
jgi:hypothetical protein